MTKRRSKRGKGIKTTIVVPRWQRNLRAGVKGLKNDFRNILAAAGLLWLLVMVVRAIGNW